MIDLAHEWRTTYLEVSYATPRSDRRKLIRGGDNRKIPKEEVYVWRGPEMNVMETREEMGQSPHERATAPASCILKSSGEGGVPGSTGSFVLWRVRDGREDMATKGDSLSDLRLVATGNRGRGSGCWGRRCVVSDRVRCARSEGP